MATGDTPGAELFRSDREFQLTAYTPSHSQLLLSSFKRMSTPTRIDVLFKPVRLMKVRDVYKGLRISYATEEQAERVRADVPGVASDFLDSVLILETQGETDYVVAGGCAWHEDEREQWEMSHFAFFQEETLGGRVVHAGLDADIATPADLVDAVLSGAPPLGRRSRYRDVYVVKAELIDDGVASDIGVFVTRAEAESARDRIAKKQGVGRCWIEATPLAI